MPCRAIGCDFQHDKPYCAACKDNDSDHRLPNCSKRHGMTLHHGTHRDNVQKILSDGLNESQHGNLGKGVYFVYGYEIAKAIAQKQNRAWGVIEARVDLGRCKSLYQDSPADTEGRWQDDHDSVFQRHGPWATVWEKEFREFNVKKEQVMVTQAFHENGEVVSTRPKSNLLLMAGLMITAATLYKTRGNKSQTLKAFFTRIQT